MSLVDAGPLNESEDDADLHAKYGENTLCLFMLHNSFLETLRAQSLLMLPMRRSRDCRHGTLTSRLCKRKRAIGHIGKTTLQ